MLFLFALLALLLWIPFTLFFLGGLVWAWVSAGKEYKRLVRELGPEKAHTLIASRFNAPL